MYLSWLSYTEKLLTAQRSESVNATLDSRTVLVNGLAFEMVKESLLDWTGLQAVFADATQTAD